MDVREHQVGRFILDPHRQLLDRGRPVPVKPKALAILSVLAEANGELVTKDELMAAVWPNITVEDNAIQAHVTSLRKVLGEDAELLCTVHGHGYRLVSSASPAPDHAKDLNTGLPHQAGHLVRSILAVMIVITVAVAGFLYLRDRALPRQERAQVVILNFDVSGPEMAGFAKNLKDRISAELSDAQVLAVSEEYRKGLLPAARPDAEFLLQARISPDGKMLVVHVELSDAAEGVALWSATFQKDMDASNTLLPSVSTAVADAAHFGIIGRNGKVRLEAAGVAALIEARESMTTVNRPNPLLQMANYRKIIAMAPNFSWAHSGLAAADGFQLRADPGNQSLRAEAVREAKRALELEPANGEAYLALALALPRFNWEQREALLLKGMKADPGFGPAAVMEGRLRLAVGRDRDALFWFNRARNIDPLHNNNNFSTAVSLQSQGFPEESRKILEQMDAQWPDHIATRNAHFWVSLLAGKTAETLAILADAGRWPVGMNKKSAQAWRISLEAQADNEKVVRAIRAVKDSAAQGSLGPGEALLLLSLLKDIEGAFDQAQHYIPLDPQWGPYLFLDATKPMRQDPRFMALAVKYGFAAYWRATGQWPDFCNQPDLPYDCKAQVEKLAASNPRLDPMPDSVGAPIPY